MRLFPYAPRPFQDEIVTKVTRALSSRGHVVLESGTGSGKTVCALAGAIDVAVREGKRVLYLTRTNSQQRQVVHEFRKIRERAGAPWSVVGLQGRKNLCTLAKEDPELAEADTNELSRMCRDLQRATLDPKERRGARDGCSYYANLVRLDKFEVLEWAKGTLPTAEELLSTCESQRICPYEVTKSLVADALVVAAPYVYLFEPGLRQAFMNWAHANVGDFVVVVDEAHNLPAYARELFSHGLSVAALDRARDEVARGGDASAERGVGLGAFLETLAEVVGEIAKEHVRGEDGPVPPDCLEVELMHRLKLTSRGVDELVRNLVEYGDAIREKRRAEGKVPRSYAASVGESLRFWASTRDEAYVRLAVGGDEPGLAVACLEASEATGVLREAFATLHMSGTLAPLEEYRDTVGLPPETLLLSYPSPFADGHRREFLVPDVTTRYEDRRTDPGNLDRIAEHVRHVARATERSTAVFFPSFDLLAGVAARTRDLAFLRETPELSQQDLMRLAQAFAKKERRLLYAVFGGRLSEGMDFPAEELEVVVLVGLPYPKPTFRQAALQRYMDFRFGRGFEYAVEAPMVRKTLQAAGRLLRGPDDRGVVVLLDRRGTRLSSYLPRMTVSHDVAADVRAFFSERK
ncbi:MAG: ATP-dependent DNA helicase [Methanobacteriota archaeon]